MGIRTVRIVATAAFAFAAMAAGPAAFAGEVNGHGEKTPPGSYEVPSSICSFSGLNDNPDDPAPLEGGRVQSFGALIKQFAAFGPGSIAMMKEDLQANKPGIWCNKNTDLEEH